MTAPYTVQQWHDNNTSPPYGPLDGDRLNHMEAGILAASVAANVSFSPKTFGAVGDGVADDYAYIMEAYAALVTAGGGVLDLGGSSFAFGSPLSFTSAVPLTIRGSGAMGATLKPTFAAGDAITVNGPGLFAMNNLAITPTVNRTVGTYLLHVKNCVRPMVSNVYVNNGVGGLFMFEACNFVQMSDCQGDANSGVLDTSGGTCLRIKASGGTFENLMFRTSGGAPALWASGVSTTLLFSNSMFCGGGPHSSFAVSSITSGPSSFTVTTPTTHDFQAGDFLVLRGMTPAAYNDQWRIASVTSTTITVNTTANPGSSSVNGTAESVSACVLISNEDGAINESSISNCQFAAPAFANSTRYGEAALYFDGRRGTAGARGTLSGWNLTGNYHDYGSTGILLSGTAAGGSNDPTTHGISITGGTFVQTTRALHLDQVVNVTFSDLVGSPAGVGIAADSISAATGLYIYAGPSAPFSRAILGTSSTLGSGRNYGTSPSFTYGAIIDSPGIQDLKLTGVQLNGATGPLLLVNSPRASTSRWILSDTPREQLARESAGVIAECFSPFLTNNASLAPTSQVTTGMLVGLKVGDVVTGIVLRNVTAAAGTLPTTARFGLADSTGKILVLSGNLNALANWVQGPITFPFTAPYTVLADGSYYPVFVVNGTWGTTQPTLLRAAGGQFAGNPLGSGAALAIQQAGQTDLPAIGSSVTVAGGNNNGFYMGVY